jgi:hypothetical protein
MELPYVINTRADLEALAGSPAYDQFMVALAGSLWRLEKDDAAGTWRAVEDDATIARFGFARSDFPEAQPPALPPYVAPVVPAIVVSPWKIRKALNALGLREAVETAVAQTSELAIKDGWQFATEFRSDDPFVLALGQAIGQDAAQIRELFELAQTL